LRVAEPVLEALTRASATAAPFETGGLLVGVRTLDGLWITDAVEIAVRGRSRRRFVIPSGSTRVAVDALRSADPRIGYIGDWHSHPADSSASAMDLRTLATLAVGVFGRRRLIAVVRNSGPQWSLDVWVQGKFGVPTTCPFEISGPLPPPGSQE
jgi:proteasome lid subunit RPN8/RPN11